jgi:hypothetical protein
MLASNGSRETNLAGAWNSLRKPCRSLEFLKRSSRLVASERATTGHRQVGNGGSVEPQRNVAVDLVDGVMPSVEIDNR